MAEVGRWRHVLVLAVAGALVGGCSGGSDDGAADVTDVIAVEDFDAAGEEPDAESEPAPEVAPDLADDGATATEPAPAPDPRDGMVEGEYDGYPIDEPVEDISVIDEAYVEEVLRVLDRNYLDVVRAVQELGVENIDAAAYTESLLRPLARTYTRDLEWPSFERTVEFVEGGEFEPAPQPVRSAVSRLLTVSDDCISAELQREARPMYTDGGFNRWTQRPARMSRMVSDNRASCEAGC